MFVSRPVLKIEMKYSRKMDTPSSLLSSLLSPFFSLRENHLKGIKALPSYPLADFVFYLYKKRIYNIGGAFYNLFLSVLPQLAFFHSVL